MHNSRDFRDLLVDSQRLAASTSNNDVSLGGGRNNLRRGIAELEEASRYLASGNERQTKTSRSMDEFHSRLDVIGHRPTIRQSTPAVTFEPQEFCHTNLEGYLQAEQDKVINNLIDKATEMSAKNSRKVFDRWATQEWQSSKKKFMETLGYRSYHMQQQRESSSSQALVTIGNSSTLQPRTLTQASVGVDVQSQIHEPYLSAHVKFVRSLSEQDASKHQDVRPCSQLLDAIAAVARNDADEIGYTNLIRALTHATGESSIHIHPKPCGYFAPVAVREDLPADAVAEKRRELSRGMKTYFERQFEDFMRNQIQQGIGLGRVALPSSASGESRRHLIRAYVQYLFRSSRIPAECSVATYDDSPHTATTDKATVHLWPLVYFSLRIGALEVAREEMDQCVSHGVRGIDGACITLVATFCKLLQTASTGAQSLNNFTEALVECRTTHQQLLHDPQADPYRLAVLNLLSFASPGDLAIPESTLEDFLWGQLWCVFVSGVAYDHSGGSVGVQIPYGITPGTLTTTKCFTEEELYRCIIDYGGADYFDPKRAFPFKYALVLLTCQRFGDAVLYLWSNHKALAAIHLATSLLHYGLLLPHAPLTAPFHTIRNTLLLSDSTPCSLLKIWIQQFFDEGFADIAVDYLLALNVPWTAYIKGLVSAAAEETLRLRSQQAVGELLEYLLISSNTQQLKLIVGEPCEDESREISRRGGRLDAYLSSEDADTLLARAAYVKLSRDLDPQGAIYLYTLAGRYADVIDVLNSQLLHSATSDAARSKVFEVAKEFYKKYIVGGQGRVVSSLQRHGRLDLARTLEFLLSVCSFFELASSRKFIDALTTLDGLQLLPKDEADVGPASQHLNSLDMALFKILDALLLRAMDCTTEAYKAAKSDYRSKQPGVLSERDNLLSSLRKRAKALVSFAGTASQRLMYSDTCSVLARAEMDLITFG